MKSLAEREAFRKKQREAERKDPEAQKGTRGDEESQRAEGTGEDEGNKGPMDAKTLLAKSVGDVAGSLSGLSNDDLVKLRAEEMGGKKRAGVIDAISNEENKRKAATSSWNRNA